MSYYFKSNLGSKCREKREFHVSLRKYARAPEFGVRLDESERDRREARKGGINMIYPAHARAPMLADERRNEGERKINTK